MKQADGFLARWSRRKAQGLSGEAAPATPPAAPAAVATPARAESAAPSDAPIAGPVDRPPPPTLEEVAELTPASDFRRFVAPDATPDVKNAALKKLFADPQFNVMDGLDTYIDDYGKPDPIPAAMLRLMVQAQGLGLFNDEIQPAAVDAGAGPDSQAALAPAQSVPEPNLPSADDQDPAVRLQSHDAAGPHGAAEGAGQDPGRQR